MQTLASPIIKREALLYWAENATISVNTLSSSTYQQQLTTAFNQYFTEDGKNSLTAAFESKGTISDIVAKKLSVTSVVQETPILMDTGKLFGHTVWKVQVPILVTFESLNQIEVDKQLITLMIVSVDTTINPLGILIDSYSAEKR